MPKLTTHTFAIFASVVAPPLYHSTVGLHGYHVGPVVPTQARVSVLRREDEDVRASRKVLVSDSIPGRCGSSDAYQTRSSVPIRANIHNHSEDVRAYRKRGSYLSNPDCIATLHGTSCV